MNCPNCGASNAEDTKFCVTCGTRLEAAVPPPPPPPVYSQPQQQSYQQPPQQGYQPTQQAYQPIPPIYGAPAGDPNKEPLKTSQFFWMDLLIGIPIVGLVLLFVWGFGSNVNENRKNWCKAKLIWALVGIVISIILVIIVAAMGIALGDLTYYF